MYNCKIRPCLSPSFFFREDQHETIFQSLRVQVLLWDLGLVVESKGGVGDFVIYGRVAWVHMSLALAHNMITATNIVCAISRAAQIFEF